MRAKSPVTSMMCPNATQDVRLYQSINHSLNVKYIIQPRFVTIYSQPIGNIKIAIAFLTNLNDSTAS